MKTIDVKRSVQIGIILIFTASGLFIFGQQMPFLTDHVHWNAILAYAILSLVCSFTTVRTLHAQITFNNAVLISGIILFGASISVWAALIELILLAILMGMSVKRIGINAGVFFVTVWVADVFHRWLVMHSVPWMIGDLVLIGAYLIVNALLVGLGVFAVNGVSLYTVIRSILKDSGMVYLLIILLGDLGARLTEIYGAYVLIPLTTVYLIVMRVFNEYFSKLKQVEHQFSEIQYLNDSFLTTMAAAIDARDPYTHGHSNRVAYWAREIAKAIELSEEQVERVYHGGILHDIGKIGIEDRILRKPGKLTNEEYERIKDHPTIGYNLVKQAGVFEDLLPAIRWHHERIDGKGYPDGLKGEEIPLMARILAVSDAWDAMVSDRPYRKGLSFEVALDQIDKGLGTQFDEQLAVVFMELIRNTSDEELQKIYYQQQNDTLLEVASSVEVKPASTDKPI